MDSKIKQKAKGRVLTIISKLDELKQLGYEDSDLNDLLPCCMETLEQELTNTYIELTS